MKALFNAFLLFIVFVSLWFIFSYFQTGDWLQISGLAKKLHHSSHKINFFSFSFVKFIESTIADNSYGWFIDFYSLKNYYWYRVGLAVALILYSVLLIKKKSWILWLFNFSAIAYFLFYIFYMNYFSYWYLGSIYIVVFISVTIFFKEIKVTNFFLLSSILITIILFAFLTIYKYKNYDFKYNSIAVQIKIAEYFEQNNIRNKIVGSFDSGLNGYFFSFYKKKYGITVINLDCLANNQLYRRIKKNQFVDFLVENNISYLIEGITLYEHISWLGNEQRNDFFNRIKNRKNIYYDMIVSEFQKKKI